MKVLLVYDENETSGIGHYMRIQSIQRILKKKKYDFLTLLSDEYKNYINFSVYNLSDFIIVDSYTMKKEDYEELSKHGNVIALDDYNRIEYPSNVEVVHPSINGYNFIRKEFWNPPEKKIRKKVERVMVFLGGSKKADEAIKILVPKLKKAGFDVRVLFPTDRHFFTAEEILHTMLWADYAFVGCGVSILECAKVGIPATGVVLSDNQSNNATDLFLAGYLTEAIQLRNLKTYNVGHIKNLDRKYRKTRSLLGRKALKHLPSDFVNDYIKP